jgi:hypothetical protein
MAAVIVLVWHAYRLAYIPEKGGTGKPSLATL